MDYSKNPVVAVATDIEFSIGEQTILDKANLTIHQGERIGLVGRNGSGKSSFLKILSGVYEFFAGEIDIRKGIELGFLSQEFTLDASKTVYENILDGARHLLLLLDEYKTLPPDSPRFAEVDNKILVHDAWNLEKRIDELIEKLGAPSRDSSIVTLSGGEKRRVALCRALVAKPDLLVLDEPTNHLDMQTIQWLENFVRGYSGTCIFVTHDRYFLDKIATRILELANGVFYNHDGNYATYLEEKALRIQIDQNRATRMEKFLELEYEWIKRGPKARTGKSKSRINRFYDILDAEAPERDPDMDILLPLPPYLGKKIVNLHYISHQFGDNTLFKDFNFRFQKGQKIGIIGKNGSGKTTLLKIIMEQLKPTSGNVETSQMVEFNYADQAKMMLDEEKSVFEEVGDGYDHVVLAGEKVSLWTYLKRFLFEDERIKTVIKNLSGGERSRVTLAKIFKYGGNFIILDEPTNDLDLSSLRVLEESLLNFDGVVVVVSHDRYFLNRVCTDIFAFEGDGKIHHSVGDYDFYKKKLDKRLKEQKALEEPKQKIKKQKPKADKPSYRKLTWKEQKELEAMEERIMEAEEEVSELETIFSAPDFYEEYGDQIKELTDKLNTAKENAEKLYQRWDELERIKNGEVEG